MSAVARTFLDTNVVVYPWDRSEISKAPFAEKLLQDVFRAGRPLLSVQVLSEFFWTVTHKLAIPLTADEAAAEIRRLRALAYVALLTEELLEQALDAVTAYGLALWDAQIFAAAKPHYGTTVLSEDFAHRRTIEGVTFLNPFAPDFSISEILGV